MENNLLDKKHVEKWINNLSRLGVGGIVDNMENLEYWTGDINHIAKRLSVISSKLTSDPNYKLVDRNDVDEVDTLIYLLGHMPASQAFRFINLAHKNQSDISEILTDRAQYHCENKGKYRAEARVMIDRVLVFLRSRCFSLVFGQNRRDSIMAILNIN